MLVTFLQKKNVEKIQSNICSSLHLSAVFIFFPGISLIRLWRKGACIFLYFKCNKGSTTKNFCLIQCFCVMSVCFYYIFIFTIYNIIDFMETTLAWYSFCMRCCGIVRSLYACLPVVFVRIVSIFVYEFRINENKMNNKKKSKRKGKK